MIEKGILLCIILLKQSYYNKEHSYTCFKLFLQTHTFINYTSPTWEFQPTKLGYRNFIFFFIFYTPNFEKLLLLCC